MRSEAHTTCVPPPQHKVLKGGWIGFQTFVAMRLLPSNTVPRRIFDSVRLASYRLRWWVYWWSGEHAPICAVLVSALAHSVFCVCSILFSPMIDSFREQAKQMLHAYECASFAQVPRHTECSGHRLLLQIQRQALAGVQRDHALHWRCRIAACQLRDPALWPDHIHARGWHCLHPGLHTAGGL